MRQVIPYAPEHRAAISAQAAQASSLDEPGALPVDAGPAWTIMADGAIIAIAGLAANAPGYLTGWALLADDLTLSELRYITRCVAAKLNEQRAHRIDMMVEADFEPGRRWAAMLGFVHEARLGAYGARGINMDVYAMIRREFLP